MVLEIIEDKKKFEVLFSYDKQYNSIMTEMYDNKKAMNLQNKKLSEFANKFQEGLKLITKNEKELNQLKEHFTIDGKIDYKKLIEFAQELEKNPKSYVKNMKAAKPVLDNFKAQDITNEIKDNLAERNNRANNYYNKRSQLSKKADSNMETAKKFGMLSEFAEYIKSSDKYNTRLTKKYLQALKDIKSAEKANPEKFAKILKDNNLDEKVTQKHSVIQTIEKAKFKTKAKTKNHTMKK